MHIGLDICELALCRSELKVDMAGSLSARRRALTARTRRPADRLLGDTQNQIPCRPDSFARKGSLMMVRLSVWISSLGTTVALVALPACGFGSGHAKASPASLDDLVRSVKGVDNKEGLLTRLKNVNSGQLAVDTKVASQFTQQPGVISRVMAKADVDVGLACEAYDAGYQWVQDRQGANRQTAQGHLEDMRAQVNVGETSALTVKLACEVQETLSEL